MLASVHEVAPLFERNRAFEQVHGGQPAPLPREERQPQVYTEIQRERFHGGKGKPVN
jgi:hypothetical protein